MLHSTLSALLVSVASRYAELSPSDVGIGIGGGRLVIDNVQLRADTFNAPNIPFHVHEGRAGRLRINVPWSALSSAPVEVYLENVRLIAGPKQPHPEQSHPQSHAAEHPDPHTKPLHDASPAKGKWHQTMVGRLLFNVSVEIYGLKVEYRDDECVGIISIASVRADSAGPDWQSRFVSLLSHLDPEQPEASTVSMRKLVRLNGVHWVMIPRRQGAPPAAEHLTVNSGARSPRLSELQLDLDSYESKSPILPGIAVTVRVLMCTGKALVSQSLLSGLHAEAEIDLEEPNITLTARQIRWMDKILKEGLGITGQTNDSKLEPYSWGNTKRKPRSPVTPSDALDEDQSDLSRTVSNHNRLAASAKLHDREVKPGLLTAGVSALSSSQQSHSSLSGLDTAHPGVGVGVRSQNPENTKLKPSLSAGDVDSLPETSVFPRDEAEDVDDAERSKGGFRSLWEAIVGENADETIDDAAVALGLEKGYFSDEDVDKRLGDSGEDEADMQNAREAVHAAAAAGGFTFQVRLRTPDLAATDEVERLRAELRSEKEYKIKLENVEDVLMETEKRMKESEKRSQELGKKNEFLAKELEDLERMTSHSAKNKDAMIRQMEAALAKAERQLQLSHPDQAAKVKTAGEQYDYEAPKSTQADSDVIQKPVPYRIDFTEHGEESPVDVAYELDEGDNKTQNERIRTQPAATVKTNSASGDGSRVVCEVSGHSLNGSSHGLQSSASAPPVLAEQANPDGLSGLGTSQRQRRDNPSPTTMFAEDTLTDISLAEQTTGTEGLDQGTSNGRVRMDAKTLEQAMSSEGLTLV